MAVLHDPGAFLPTGPRAHRAASAARSPTSRDASSADSSGRRQHRGGVPLYTSCNSGGAARRIPLAGRHRVPVHVHIRSGVPGLKKPSGWPRQTKAPLHIVHINSSRDRGDPRNAADDRGRAASGHGRHDRGVSVHSGNDRDSVGEPGRIPDGPAERLAQLEWPRTGERLNRGNFQKYRQMGGPVVLHTNTEEMVKAAVNSPLTMIASDAYWENGTRPPADDRNLYQSARPLRPRASRRSR